jgi:hypothetical protein
MNPQKVSNSLIFALLNHIYVDNSIEKTRHIISTLYVINYLEKIETCALNNSLIKYVFNGKEFNTQYITSKIIN